MSRNFFSKKLTRLSNFLMPLFWGAIYFQTGCGPAPTGTTQPTDTSCASGIAKIGIGAGLVSLRCGCDEGAIAPTSNSLTCTVPAGTRILFELAEIENAHQIQIQNPARVGTTGDEWIAGPARHKGYYSQDAFPPQMLFNFPNTGSFRFRDSYQNQVQGTIVVR